MQNVEKKNLIRSWIHFDNGLGVVQFRLQEKWKYIYTYTRFMQTPIYSLVHVHCSSQGLIIENGTWFVALQIQISSFCLVWFKSSWKFIGIPCTICAFSSFFCYKCGPHFCFCQKEYIKLLRMGCVHPSAQRLNVYFVENLSKTERHHFTWHICTHSSIKWSSNKKTHTEIKNQSTNNFPIQSTELHFVLCVLWWFSSSIYQIASSLLCCYYYVFFCCSLCGLFQCKTVKITHQTNPTSSLWWNNI